METRPAIINGSGNYCCPHCFIQFGSIFNFWKTLPNTCPYCGQEVSYDPESDWKLYVEKNRLEQIYVRSHGHAH